MTGQGEDAAARVAFVEQICRNDINRRILDRWPHLNLPDGWLVAGCLFQTVWNLRAGRPPGENIRDYDMFYFDPDDLSWEAEDREIRRVTRALQDIPAKVELRNQARVHLWYAERFGPGYPPLRSSKDGIDRFLIDCTRVGVSVADGGRVELYAPAGLADLRSGILRPNPRNDRPALFVAKAQSYSARWPWLRVVA